MIGFGKEAVIGEENYLQSSEIMAYFMGDHIKYDVENYRMVCYLFISFMTIII